MNATCRAIPKAVAFVWLTGAVACAVERHPDAGGPGMAAAPGATAADQRVVDHEQMIEDQLKSRGITDSAVLDAMARVPRHEFVPASLQSSAYEDHPLPIGHEQTISQPYIVAYMTQTLELSPEHTVLEVGTGSGYQAAILGELARDVYSIEIIEELADAARRRLGALGYDNVFVRTGNGYEGWTEHAPYDRIIVTAAPPEIPEALTDQLALGGRLVIPVGTWNQEIVIVTRTESGLSEDRTLPVRFVPMTGGPRDRRPSRDPAR